MRPVAKVALVALALIFVTLLASGVIRYPLWPAAGVAGHAMLAGESAQPSSKPPVGKAKVTRNGYTVISQGRAEHGAAAWNTAGYNGSGVKVGIIDTGFAGIRALQNSGELPRNVTAHCYNLSVPATDPPTASSDLAVCDQGSKHGSAVAEAIYRCRPGSHYI